MFNKNQFLATYDQLKSEAQDAQNWIRSEIGADLWIDGANALKNSVRDHVELLIDRAIDWSLENKATGVGIRTLLQTFDRAREFSYDNHSPFDLLAFGIILLKAQDRDTRYFGTNEDNSLFIMNDTVMTLVSKNYRHLKFESFNNGILYGVAPGDLDPVFRPDYGSFYISQQYLTELEPKRIQWFNISHDMIHLAMYGDTYRRIIDNPVLTAELLLCAEETCCSFDLLVASELFEFFPGLHILWEMSRIETGDLTKSYIHDAALHTDLDPDLQMSLKIKALNRLNMNGQVSDYIRRQKFTYQDTEQWFSGKSLQKHVSGILHDLKRVNHPEFVRYSNLLPDDCDAEKRLNKSREKVWKRHEIVFKGCYPDARKRDKNIRRNHIKKMILQLGEVSALLYDLGLPFQQFNQLVITHSQNLLGELKQDRDNLNELIYKNHSILKNSLNSFEFLDLVNWVMDRVSNPELDIYSGAAIKDLKNAA